MAATTSIFDDVKLVEKAAIDFLNYEMQFEFGMEDHRRRSNIKLLEDVLRILYAEQPINRVYSGIFQCLYYRIYDSFPDTAYEKAEISFDYYADPTEEIVKPPVADLETLLASLTTLPRLR
jgi:hypothetical protein